MLENFPLFFNHSLWENIQIKVKRRWLVGFAAAIDNQKNIVRYGNAQQQQQQQQQQQGVQTCLGYSWQWLN